MYAVVDVETTGLDPAVDRVVEVAVVRMLADGRVLDEYATLVHPGGPARAVEIHGITDELLRGAPAFVDVGAALAARLAGTVVAGHNVAFDLAFLRAEYARLGVVMPVLPSVCTRELARGLAPGLARRRLADCCAEAGVPLDGAHTALGDARATGRLLAVYLARRARTGRVAPAAPWPTGLPCRGRRATRPGGE